MTRHQYNALRQLTGNAGTVVVAGTHAYVWSDAGPSFELRRSRQGTWRVFAADTHAPVGTLYADGYLSAVGH